MEITLGQQRLLSLHHICTIVNVVDCLVGLTILKPWNPPIRRHAFCVAAVSPLHGIPLITSWPSPENANQHRCLINTGVRFTI